MKFCSWCLNSFDSENNRQIYCSVDCRVQATKERQAEIRRKNRKQKRCATKGCSGKVSAHIDSVYCRSCYLSDSVIELDLKMIKRMMNG